MQPIIVRHAASADAALIADLSHQPIYEIYVSSNTKKDKDKFMNEQFSKQALGKEVKTGKNYLVG